MRVGVLKPDHLGDLVLAAPALAALWRRFPNLVLFCHPQTCNLAEHLFPGMRLRPILFPHLDRGRTATAPDMSVTAVRQEVDRLICLRWDSHLAGWIENLGLAYPASGLDRFDIHVAVEQRAVAFPLTGPYNLLSSYQYPLYTENGGPPVRPRAVGLCVAAGFHLNAWPAGHWLALAERLHGDGVPVVLIGGPAERARLHVLGEVLAASLGHAPRCIIGGDDFGAFLGEVAATTDLVVATDSGTAHLVSLVRPVLSLFGGSPWRRFAPLGRHNAVLSREYHCSPCRQFDRATVNTCHTQECLNNLFPGQVHACLQAYLEGIDLSRPRLVHGVWMARAPWEWSPWRCEGSSLLS